MEISGSGVGASGPSLPSALRAIERLAGSASLLSSSDSPGDSLGSLFRELSQADLTRLAGVLEFAPSARAVELLQTIVRLAAQPEPGPAIHQLAQLLQSEPLLAETVASEPGLERIRPAVDALLNQMAGPARLNAGRLLAEAGDKWDRAITADAGLVKPEALFLVAARLLDAGGLANCRRSMLVTDLLIKDAQWVPVEIPGSAPQSMSHSSLTGVVMLWAASGLAAVLLGWMHFSADDWGLEIWAAGLLILSCFWGWRHIRQ